MSSIITCTAIMVETIGYYKSYLLLLDASKDFDRVEYTKLVKLLKSRNMCPILLRLTMNMYISQQMQAKWNGSISKSFSISNDVKQGGLLYSVLFSIYIDKLISILRKRNIGCKIKNNFMGLFRYAESFMSYYNWFKRNANNM